LAGTTEWKIYWVKKKGKSTLKAKPLLFALVRRKWWGGGQPSPIQLFILCYYASGKKGFFVAEKKDGVRSQIYIFMNNSFDKKKNPKKGKKTVFICKGSPQKRSCFDFFSHTPLFKDVQPFARFPNSNKN